MTGKFQFLLLLLPGHESSPGPYDASCILNPPPLLSYFAIINEPLLSRRIPLSHKKVLFWFVVGCHRDGVIQAMRGVAR